MDFLTIFYKASIAAAFGAAIYIYGFLFDDLSETTLVRITPAWFFPLVFGIYGLVAEKLLELIRENRAENLAAAAALWTRAFGLLGLVCLFPFLFLKGNSSVTVAFWGAAIWTLLLAVFFEAIFPLL